MRYETLHAKAAHVGLIASRLRPEDAAELSAGGEKPRHVLMRLWRDSDFCKVAFVDGEIAAMWGCAGSMLSPIGEVWLFTTSAVERVPLAFAKVARLNIAQMMETKTALVSAVLDGYEKSIRLWRMLGFNVGEPSQVGSMMFRELRMER